MSVFLILFKTSLQSNFYRSFSFVVYFYYRYIHFIYIYIFMFDQIDRRIKESRCSTNENSVIEIYNLIAIGKSK